MKNYRYMSATVTSLMAASLLTACQGSGQSDEMGAANNGQEYELVSMKSDSGEHNVSADKSSVFSVPAEDTSNTTQSSSASENSNEPEPAEVVVETVTEEVEFAFDSHALTPMAKAALDKLVSDTQDMPVEHIDVVLAGHTDAIGTDQYNDHLSRERADAVQNYLEGEFPDTHVSWDLNAYGEDRPTASNNSAAGRQDNRRVVITVTPDMQKQTAQIDLSSSAPVAIN